MGEFQVAQTEVARLVGRDRSTVSNVLRLLKLPESVRALVHGEQLSEGHARALLGLDTATAIEKLAHEAAANGWSVREVEERVPAGDAIAVWPSPTPSGGRWATVPPYPYVGDPELTRRVELARTPVEAVRRSARWAILPAAVVDKCEPGWRIEYSVAGWHLLARDPGVSCTPP